MDWYLVTDINPEPWTASEGSVGRKSGKMFVMFHKPTQLRNYQEALKTEFVKQNPEYTQLSGLVSLELYFWRRLEQVESDRRSRAHIADATNLQKATEDALQKILFPNDRDIRRITSEIISQSADTDPAILIGIQPYERINAVHAVATRSELLVQREAERSTLSDNSVQRPEISDIF